jgi:hypothetical protein
MSLIRLGSGEDALATDGLNEKATSPMDKRIEMATLASVAKWRFELWTPERIRLGGDFKNTKYSFFGLFSKARNQGRGPSCLWPNFSQKKGRI